ncbi:MAG: TIGR04282 family arsenosugar biosynthesis glycosyltransferase [Bacteroidota bacterium]
MNNRALLIFIKNPERGKVKTRIAKTAGDEKAYQVYLELSKHTRKIAEQFEANRLLFYSQFINQKDDWSAEDFQKNLQAAGDLGIRMVAAFQKAFEQNEKVVIIGSDCASLTSNIVEEAFAALDAHDFVVGPAKDGGYYLLGMRAFQPSVFDQIEWSTEQVFRNTIRNIKKLEASYALMPVLSDIDYWEDWLEYGWELTD